METAPKCIAFDFFFHCYCCYCFCCYCCCCYIQIAVFILQWLKYLKFICIACRYRIQQGSFDDFTIDNQTGLISIARKLDYDKRENYRIEVVASDLGKSQTNLIKHFIKISLENKKSTNDIYRFGIWDFSFAFAIILYNSTCACSLMHDLWILIDENWNWYRWIYFPLRIIFLLYRYSKSIGNGNRINKFNK